MKPFEVIVNLIDASSSLFVISQIDQFEFNLLLNNEMETYKRIEITRKFFFLRAWKYLTIQERWI